MQGPTKFVIGSRWKLRAKEVARRKGEKCLHADLVVVVTGPARFGDPGKRKLCTFEVPGHPPGKCSVVCGNGLSATLTAEYVDSIAFEVGGLSLVPEEQEAA